jgi:hypothetical protein
MSRLMAAPEDAESKLRDFLNHMVCKGQASTFGSPSGDKTSGISWAATIRRVSLERPVGSDDVAERLGPDDVIACVKDSLKRAETPYPRRSDLAKKGKALAEGAAALAAGVARFRRASEMLVRREDDLRKEELDFFGWRAGDRVLLSDVIREIDNLPLEKMEVLAKQLRAKIATGQLISPRHRPPDERRVALGIELAAIFSWATENKPTFSSEATFEKPMGDFGEFVVLAAALSPHLAAELRRGFPRFLRDACDNFESTSFASAFPKARGAKTPAR